MPRRPYFLLSLLAAPVLLYSAYLQFRANAQPLNLPGAPVIHAPDFPKDFAWLNTSRPLSFQGNLKGQVVLLDFWTYCCINCMHVLPDLEYLEQKFKDQPVVIVGVHSNKFDNEASVDTVRAAVQRYNVHHPVVVDQDHKIWDAFTVNSWPTLVLVGADGEVIGAVSGEGHRELLENVITKALADAKAKNTLAQAPLKLEQEGVVRAASGLAFPAKVIPDPANQRLFIIDSNHNRIVQTSWPAPDGRTDVQQIIGSGKQGRDDGDFAAASFHRPQGGAINGNVLWIADTENHLVRRVDLDKKRVLTILGTGQQDFDPEAGKTGTKQALNSPWDIAVAGNRLYISQAGQHQIFSMNIMTAMAEVAAGSARENIRDGDAADANLAQPSALAYDPATQTLYFADSEVSAVRALDIPNKQVRTIIGHGLFDFGDVDGDQETARFQHCIGLSMDPDGKHLLLADTYNHKIKRIDPVARTAVTLKTDARFFEPAGIAAASDGTIFVADTNNHRIMMGKTGSEHFTELMIAGGDGLNSAAVSETNAKDAGSPALSADQDLPLSIALTLPPLNHLTPGAPVSLRLTDGARILYTKTLDDPKLPLALTLPKTALASKPASLYISLFYSYCNEGPTPLCQPNKLTWKLTPTYISPTQPPLTLK